MKRSAFMSCSSPNQTFFVVSLEKKFSNRTDLTCFGGESPIAVRTSAADFDKGTFPKTGVTLLSVSLTKISPVQAFSSIARKLSSDDGLGFVIDAKKKWKKNRNFAVVIVAKTALQTADFGVNSLYKKELNHSKISVFESVDFCLQRRFVYVNLAPALEIVVPVKR